MFHILFKFEHVKYIEGENYQMLNANKIMTKKQLKGKQMTSAAKVTSTEVTLHRTTI
jgi:hypothetical protein